MNPPNRNRGVGGDGVGIDFQGGPVIDPTENVIALVEARGAAAEQLRIADNRYYDTAMLALKEARLASILHLKEMADLRAEYAKDIRESDLRVAAQTRLVDVGGQARSAESIATAVQTLAASAARDAQILRDDVSNTRIALAKQVTDTATATTQQTATTFSAMDARVAQLEKTSNTGAGRQGVTDPHMEKLTLLVESLARSQASGTGKSEGIHASWVILLGAVSLISTLVAAVMAIKTIS